MLFMSEAVPWATQNRELSSGEFVTSHMSLDIDGVYAIPCSVETRQWW